ncbi:hypothetical protein B1H26_21375 [Amycolatopsis sp. BJA-103]|nr:hypothetical protein BKN51_13150 [Amycolatopsis sp. BJA-103]PNE17491.1 hypothetical protein B1H26_21375 [Amycolatopsis sp. BJA-103]
MLLSVAVLAGLVQPASGAPRAGWSMASAVDVQSGEPRPMPESWWRDWDGTSGQVNLGDPRLRQLVADNAELHEDVEVREAATAALAQGEAGIFEFLATGHENAMARAAARKQEAARQDRAKVEAMAGTGGPYLEAGVSRVLAGSDADRSNFVAYGAEIERSRDEQVVADVRARAALLRSRTEMLAGVGGLEVRTAAQLALSRGDAAIAEFLNGGYLVASKKDADAREAYLREQEERAKAAEQLTDLAKRAARASTARKNLLIAHGNGVRALEWAANGMIAAANEARRAAQILAANEAGGIHPPSAFDEVKREATRQLDAAQRAVTDAQQASATATVEANVLVEVNLPYGAKWAEMARGMAAASEAAAGAAQTARQAIDATAAVDAARNAQEKAERHAEEAAKWRTHAEEHARSAARVAEAARVQAVAAQEAAARTKQARIEAEQAEQAAWREAAKAHEARLRADDEQRKAADQRRIAEQERANAANERAAAERDATTARTKRGEAERQAGLAHDARGRAEEQDRTAQQAADNAVAEDRKATEARGKAFSAEQARQAAEAKAQALAAGAAAAAGTGYEQEAKNAAAQARTEAGQAEQAAREARTAADAATGAAVSARTHATEATRAAARARAAADQATFHAKEADKWAREAESAAAATHALAELSNAKAAEATVFEVKAAEAARAATRLAEQAAEQAFLSLRAAERTKAEADAAAGEAVSAATQAGIAVRAAQGARASAQGVIERANTAVTIALPFTGTDLGADFVQWVAEEARRVGAEQAAAAERQAVAAQEAARLAREAADRAAAEAKPAYEAAAQAAASAGAAARSAADAQKAAADAAADGAAARAAGDRARQADAQAKADAAAARQSANTASNDAAIAGKAATAAEADATAARDAATRAENDAIAARDAASKAETDAAAARKAADHAQEAADRAADAAANAQSSATDAQKAADRAEEQARRDEAERRRQVSGQLEPGEADLTADEVEMLLASDAGGDIQAYRDALPAVNKTIPEFLLEVGAEALNGLLGIDDAKKCFGEGNIESCIWTIINIGNFIVILGKLPVIGKAIVRVVAGVVKYVEASDLGRKVLGRVRSVFSRFRLDCVVQLAEEVVPNGTASTYTTADVGIQAKVCLVKKPVITQHGRDHSFGRHAHEWFGREVTGADMPEWTAMLERGIKSKKIVPWRSGSAETWAMINRIGNDWFVVQIDRVTSELVTAFRPNSGQLSAMLKLLKE